MVQDFAKEKRSRPEPSRPPEAGLPAPGWGLVFTGVLTGALLGVFGSFLAYISGVVPPPPGSAGTSTVTAVASAEVDQEAQQQLTEELERAAARLQLEFYRELPNYEVQVDATPLNNGPEPEPDSRSSAAREPAAGDAGGTAPEPAQPATGGYLLQAGAFQQEESAQARRDELAAMGLPVRVKQEALLGRTLYLVQAGPYPDRVAVAQAERQLRNNGIETMRISPGNR